MIYFLLLLLGARCDKALPAAVLESRLVRPSFKTRLAAFPARTLVFRLFVAIIYLKNKEGIDAVRKPWYTVFAEKIYTQEKTRGTAWFTCLLLSEKDFMHSVCYYFL